MKLSEKDHRAIEDIIERRAGIASIQTQIKDDIKVIADRAGTKATQINRIIALVEKERAKGDIINGERDIIDAAGEIAGGQS